MIITRTPLRVSFVGGGTDLEAYYRTGYGAVVSTTIRQHIYVLVNRKFDDKIRVSYSKTEMVDTVDQVQHALVREAMKLTAVTRGIEVATVADVPGRGTGLGSSSSVTVGLLHAFHAYAGRYVGAARLAEEACRIEIDALEGPIGKQDQYAAAYGGLNHIQFNSEGSVLVDRVILSKTTRQDLESQILLFYTGQAREANTILAEQKQNTLSGEKLKFLNQMRDQAQRLRDDLREGNLADLGPLLHRGWEMKRQLAGGISSSEIDTWYQDARRAGATGGKILGAGGGGFLLFVVPPARHAQVRAALKGLKEVPFRIEPEGSRVIFVEEPSS